MDRVYRRFLDRNVLLAVGVLPPTLFLFGGHVWLGLVFWPASSPAASRSHPRGHLAGVPFLPVVSP